MTRKLTSSTGRVTRRQRIAVRGLHRRHEILSNAFEILDALVFDRNREEARLAEILNVDIALDLDLVGAHAFADQRVARLGDQIVKLRVELGVIELRLDLVQRLGEFVLHVDADCTETPRHSQAAAAR